MNLVNIKNKQSGEVFGFDNLDKALRTLTGIDPQGDRLGQVLLTTPSRRTFKEAFGLLERNGYTIKREGKNEPAEVEVALPVEIKSKVEKGDYVVEVPKLKTEGKEDGWAFMAAMIKQHLGESKIDPASIKAEIDAQVKEALKEHVREIVIKNVETGEVLPVGTQHYQFETLLLTIQARVNALLVGPAGSGKTSAAHSAATALGLKFYSISVGLQTTKTEFFGYMDATGKYVKTLFREAFEFGGVYLLDEMDAGNANVMTAINQALANGYCAFPDGMVSKHPDFVIVASANTFGTGANREYVGRNQLDAATLDRFAVIEWNYDEQLEADLTANKNWLRYVRTCRKNAETHKIRTIVSPRASILGTQLLAQGLKPETVKEMLIFKGINPTEKAKLIEGTAF